MTGSNLLLQDSRMHSRRPEDDKWMAQTRRGSLELCVLAILARGRRYGYDLVQALNHLQGLVLKEGTIYPLLNRLQGEGLVKSEWQPSPDGPARRYYTLTPAGEERLAAMRVQWRRFTSEVDDILGADDED
jgi:PadR family transcriptional regulator PadR